MVTITTAMKIGEYVKHIRRPELGLGKVEHVRGDVVTVLWPNGTGFHDVSDLALHTFRPRVLEAIIRLSEDMANQLQIRDGVSLPPARKP